MEAGTGPPHHWADGGQESRSIATCKKDTSLEMMTSWNERCSSPPDPSPAKAGHAERVIRCCLCTRQGVSGIQREMNQLTELTVHCPRQSRCCETGNCTAPNRGGATASGQTSLPKACAVVAARALQGKSGPEPSILGAPGTPCPPFTPRP